MFNINNMYKYLLLFPFTYYIFILYKIYKLKYSKKISGIDKYMMKYINESTIYNSILLNKDTNIDLYINSVRNKLNEINLVDRSIIELKNNITDDDETKLYNEPYTTNDPPFKLIFDTSNKILWIMANHAYIDGFTMMNTVNKILDIDINDTYNIKLPEFTYIPIFTDYIIIRTVYDYCNIKPASLKLLDNLNESNSSNQVMKKIRNIFHLKFKLDIKNNNFMQIMIWNITQIFFDIFPNSEYFNVGILFAINNPNKINNVSMILVNINKNDTINDIGNKLNNKRHMVLGSYFLMNSIENTSASKSSIDIMFSSIPAFKSDKHGTAHGAILPFTSSPIYIFNSKIGNINTSSVHMRDDYVDYDKFQNTLKKMTDIKLYRITKL